MNTAILVLGMHRSGTSATAGALARLGVAMGDRVVESVPDTANGYYEHRDVVDIHDELALQAGRTWDDPRPAAPDLHEDSPRNALRTAVHRTLSRELAGSGLWALKDPRMCRFLPGWLDLLDAANVDTRCLLVLRPPAEVAASLARRNGFSREKSAALWLDHVLEAERGSRGRPRARVRFDELVEDARSVLTRCAEELGIRWPEEVEDRAEALYGFLRGSLRHHRALDGEDPGGTFGHLADEVWTGLNATDGWPGAATIDAWYEAYAGAFAPAMTLYLEHATQVAERTSRDRSWLNEVTFRREIAATETRAGEALSGAEVALRGEIAAAEGRAGEALSGAEERIGDVIAGLADELQAHARELLRLGDSIAEAEARIGTVISELAEVVATHTEELRRQRHPVRAALRRLVKGNSR